MNALYEFARPKVLAFLKVPHDPQPPAGSPDSLQIFRAGASYYRLKLTLWALRQVGVLAAFVLGLLFFHSLVLDPPKSLQGFGPFQFVVKHPELVREWHVATWVLVFEIGGLVIALLQIPFTYAMVRLDYEYRWYMVTDRSLRIRTGLTDIRETTFSFANIQQIVIRQGPLQRLLGLSDVVVTTAGGGGHRPSQQAEGVQREPMHQGIFQAVNNAEEIRDLISNRLRVLKSAGLGDPDDPDATAAAPPVAQPPPIPPMDAASSRSQTLAAAGELLAEARALRRQLG